jgi:hypothetical protein
MKNLTEFEGHKLVENILMREHKRLKDFLKKGSILSGRRDNHNIVQNSYYTAMKIRPFSDCEGLIRLQQIGRISLGSIIHYRSSAANTVTHTRVVPLNSELVVS